MSRVASALAALGFVAACTALLGSAYAPRGMSGLDEGFVTAAAWRVVHGELPYRDFVWVRPPGSPLLHALPLLVLPPRIVVIAERFGLFACVAAYSIVAAAALASPLGTRRPPASAWLIALAGVAASLQGFPPMPWHTVDGVLLGACGIAALRCGGPPRVALGVALLCAAAACKQSFAFLLPAALVWLGLARGRALLAVGLVAASSCAVAAGGTGLALRLVAPAWSQMSTATSSGSFVHAGLLAYAGGPLALATIAGALVVAVGLAAGLRSATRSSPYVLFGACYVAALAQPLVRQRFELPPFNYPGLLLLVAAGATLAALASARLANDREELRRHGLVLLFLLLAWCAGLSWGYATPILFSVPALWAIVEAAERHAAAPPLRLATWIAALALLAQAASYRFPYREAPRSRLDRDLGAIFAPLTHVRTSPIGFARHAELLTLVERFPEPHVVLPGMPLAGFLTGAVPPLGIDWARNAETGGRGAALAAALDEQRPVAFVERTLERSCRDGPACSELAWHVEQRWTRIERGRFFDVYRHP